MPGGLVEAVEAVEAAQGGLVQGGWDAGAAVGDAQGGAGEQADGDGAAGWGEFDGVVEQVCRGFEQQVAIGVGGDAVGGVDVQGLAAVFGEGGVEVGGLFDEG